MVQHLWPSYDLRLQMQSTTSNTYIGRLGNMGMNVGITCLLACLQNYIYMCVMSQDLKRDCLFYSCMWAGEIVGGLL